jgi:hypothetical protein
VKPFNFLLEFYAKRPDEMAREGPEIVRALLVGSQSNALTPTRLLRLSKNLPHDWKEQRCFLGFAA